jgi:orotate phosphoribosyltransferase
MPRRADGLPPRTPEDAGLSREIETALRECGALKSGHFLLSSGLHSDSYCQCAALFERPGVAARLAGIMRAHIGGALAIDTVLAPALGGVLWGYQLASELGVRSLFAEREKGGEFELRRGFELRGGERVLLAEDVITTGKSVSELVPIVENAGAEVVGYAAVADRSKGAFTPGPPVFALIELDFATYEEKDVPETLARIPVEKPGSRAVKTSEAT